MKNPTPYINCNVVLDKIGQVSYKNYFECHTPSKLIATEKQIRNPKMMGIALKLKDNGSVTDIKKVGSHDIMKELVVRGRGICILP